MIVKRLADDGGSSSDEDKRPKKFAKTLTTGIKATDLLAAPLINPNKKKLNPLVKLKTAIKPGAGSTNTITPAAPSTASTSSIAPSTSSASSTTASTPVVKKTLGGLSLLGSYSDSSSQSDSDN